MRTRTQEPSPEAKVRLVREDDGLRVLTLQSPEKRNAIDEQMRQQLYDAVQSVRADRDARALVVTGSGTAFCAGADLPALFGETSRSVAELRDDLRRFYDCFLVVRRLTIPTIAAVHGPAIGAGLNLALVCDLRIAGPNARFAATFTQLGLHPGGGCTWFLVQAMGPQRALKLLLDGGSVSGEEAVNAGLALCVADDPIGAAIEMGRRYAAMEPHLVRDVKKAIGSAIRESLEATIELEAWAQASSAVQPKIQEVLARMRK